MCPVIDSPASCKFHTVIRVCLAKNMNAVDIHHELCVVYGQNVVNEGTLRQWCSMFKDGRTNARDEE
jgi:hypothetical protein